MGLFKKKSKKPFVTAIIAAGGASARMEGENKLLCLVNDAPVLARAIAAFENSIYIDEIIVVAKSDMVVEYSQLCAEYDFTKVTKVIAGGKNRTESVYKGMLQISENCQYACVHDGARPLIKQEEIANICEKAFDCGCAVAVVPVKDTIKVVEDGKIVRTVERNKLYGAQTPQVADAKLLMGALCRVLDDKIEITDDSSALEYIGMKPVAVICSYENIKITTREDITIATAILEERE